MPTDITTGLLIHYALGELSGTTAVNSGSLGTGSNGTWNNAPTYGAGKIGGAATAGATTRLAIGPGLSIASPPMSVFVWIKTSATDAPAVYANNLDIQFYVGANGLAGFINATDGIAGPLVNDNAWHHIGYTDDGVNAKLYVDGVFIDSIGTDSEGVDSNDGPYFLDANTSPLAGDDCRIYNRALSAADVAALYAFTGGTAPSITSSSTFSIPENTTAVTTLTGTGTGTLAWTKSGGDSAKFTLNSSTGVLSFTTAPDFENPTDGNTDNVYTCPVTLTGDTSPAATQTVSVTVTNTLTVPEKLAKTGYAVGSGIWNLCRTDSSAANTILGGNSDS